MSSTEMEPWEKTDVVNPVVHATEVDQLVRSPSVGQTPDECITSNTNMTENMTRTTGSSTEPIDNIENNNNDDGHDE